MEDGTAKARLEDESEDRFVPLRRQLGVSSFGLNEIILQPGQRGRIHLHERQEEVFLVLSGSLTISIEAEEQVLGEGELIRVGPDVRRQLINASGEPLRLLAMGGDGEHRGRDAVAFEAWEAAAGGTPAEIPLPADLPISGD